MTSFTWPKAYYTLKDSGATSYFRDYFAICLPKLIILSHFEKKMLSRCARRSTGRPDKSVAELSEVHRGSHEDGVQVLTTVPNN